MGMIPIRERSGRSWVGRASPNQLLSQQPTGARPPWDQAALQSHAQVRKCGLGSTFCYALDEVRQFFRVRTTKKQQVSLAQQREVFSVLTHPKEHGKLPLMRIMQRWRPESDSIEQACPLKAR
jgi:hypothetical protein